MEAPRRVQLHVVLPYKQEPRDHAQIGRLLRLGYRIAQFQRLTDRDAVVTVERADAPPAP